MAVGRRETTERTTLAESLPSDPFGDLAPFLDWAPGPERARTEKKLAATMDDMLAF